MYYIYITFEILHPQRKNSAKSTRPSKKRKARIWQTQLRNNFQVYLCRKVKKRGILLKHAFPLSVNIIILAAHLQGVSLYKNRAGRERKKKG